MESDVSGSKPKEKWASGEAYEPFMARWSRLVAQEFLEWLAVSPGSLWLDVGCGTGALTQTILQYGSPQAVKGIDSADGFLTFARGKITDPRASFQLGDAQALPVETATYDAVVSGLALNFVPHPDRMIQEMARAAKPGGLVAAYVWDYAGRMQFMRHFWNAVVALHPSELDLDEGKRFPLCKPGPLADLFQSAGLARIVVQPIDIWMVFSDFDDYWSPFLGGQGPIAGYVMSLSEEERRDLREHLRTALPTALDHTIPLMARAWAVRAHSPIPPVPISK